MENKKVVHLSCGSNHMAAVTNQGEVYTWGNAAHGKLGHTS